MLLFCLLSRIFRAPDFVVPALDLVDEPVVRRPRLLDLFFVEADQPVILQVPLDHLVRRDIAPLQGLELRLSNLPCFRAHPEPGGQLVRRDHGQVLGGTLRVPRLARLVNVEPLGIQPTLNKSFRNCCVSSWKKLPRNNNLCGFLPRYLWRRSVLCSPRETSTWLSNSFSVRGP